MMTRKNNVAMRKLNVNIDHKSVTIIWTSFSDDQNIFVKNIHKRRRCLMIFGTRVVLDHIFNPKKDKIFCPMNSVYYICGVKG